MNFNKNGKTNKQNKQGNKSQIVLV